MHRPLTFHTMLHQYRRSVKFAVEAVDKNCLRKSYADSNIVEKNDRAGDIEWKR